MTRPAITVVMPVFNSERYLPEAIESILNQTFTNFEFLIFDDGSTDHSPEIIREYARRDERVIAEFSPVNRGYAVYLNEGIRRSRGEYIARMDSDDVALPKRLELQEEFLTNNPAVGVVGSSWITIDENGTEVETGRRMAAPSYLCWRIFFGNPMSHPTVMYRREVVTSVGGYDEFRMPAEDYALWTRLLDTCLFSNIEEPLLRYRVHSNSISVTKKELQARLSFQAQMELWKKCLDIDLSSDEVSFLRRFHLGYEGLPAEASHAMFKKIIALRSLVISRFGDIDPTIHQECFKRCLYLTSRVRGRLLSQGLSMIIWLLLNYPVPLVKWFVSSLLKRLRF